MARAVDRHVYNGRSRTNEEVFGDETERQTGKRRGNAEGDHTRMQLLPAGLLRRGRCLYRAAELRLRGARREADVLFSRRAGRPEDGADKGRGTGRLRAGYGLAAERGEGGLRVFRELPERDRQGRGEPDRGPGGEAVRSGADNGAQLWPGRLGVPGGDAGQRGGFQAGGDGA